MRYTDIVDLDMQQLIRDFKEIEDSWTADEIADSFILSSAHIKLKENQEKKSQIRKTLYKYKRC